MFIQTEDTPNPATLKFLPGREVTGGESFDFAHIDAAMAGSPLATSLFQLEGVERVFLGSDFISVTKANDVEWQHLKPGVLAAIMDHYVSGADAVREDAESASEERVYEGEAAEVVATIKELIETRVRPAVAQDGGDIIFQAFDEDSGVVTLHMRGACAGCPSSTLTLKNGIENMLKHYLPQVQAVEAAL